jgi:predicted anti-sigma-YlaC factor YlaD
VKGARAGLGLALAAVLLSGCSAKKFAVNKLGDALAGSGTTFASDDDPELIKAAVPFSLKLIESLLAESPRHSGLLLAAASGFTQYSYAFVQQDADELIEHDLKSADALRARARRLYQRARRYGVRGLELRHPGLADALAKNPRAALASTTARDVPFLFWTATALGAAISMSKDDPALVADQPIVEALIDRALALDESWEQGAIHSFLIGYEMARQGAPGDPAARARQHFDRAVELSRGGQAGVFVFFAESVSIEQQNRKEFQSLLEKALAIDPDAVPELRLLNLVAQRRARWLLGRVDELFLNSGASEAK